jgi:hypothetical protein
VVGGRRSPGRRSPPRSRWSPGRGAGLAARDVLRLGVGLLLLIVAAGLVGNALAPGDDQAIRSGSGSSRRSRGPPSRRSSPRRSGCTSTSKLHGSRAASRRSITGLDEATCDGRRRATTR